MDNYLLKISQEHIQQEQEVKKAICIFCEVEGVLGFDLQKLKNNDFNIQGEDILHENCIELFKQELKKR